MIKHFNFADIYISLWYLNTFQAIYIQNSAISMSFYIPFILISFYYVYNSILKYPSNKYIKWLFILYILLVFYGTINVFFGSSFDLGHHVRSNREFLLGVLNSLTPIFAFYVFTIKGSINENTFIKWIIPFIILTTLEYHKDYEMSALRHYSLNKDEFTNNVGYTFLSLAPFVFFLYKKTIFQYLFLGYTLFFTISSFKRGAIFIAILFLFWFLIRTFKSVPTKKKIYVFLISLFLIILGFYFIDNLFFTSDYFQYRVQQTIEMNSSGRDNLYSFILNSFLNESSLIGILFGHGADGSIILTGNLAHSDWFELLCNCGLLGVVVYIIYWVKFYKIWMYLKCNHLLFSLIGSCFIITFMSSIFSMSYNDLSFYNCMSIGFCIGHYYILKNNKKI